MRSENTPHLLLRRHQPPPPPPPDEPPPPPPPLELAAATPADIEVAAIAHEAVAPAPPNDPPPPVQPPPELPLLLQPPPRVLAAALAAPNARHQRSICGARPKAMRYGAQPSSSCGAGRSSSVWNQRRAAASSS